MRSTKVALSLAALSAALLSTAAFAQDFKYPVGRAANDGGQVQAQQQAPDSGQHTGSASNAQATRRGGDVYAFGGQGAPAAQQYHYPVGRAANDGGMVTAQTSTNLGTQRTGAADRERTTRGPGYASNTGSMTGGTLYNSAAPQGGYHYPVGRAANDGGMVSPQEQGR
jgi:hypothetical protein